MLFTRKRGQIYLRHSATGLKINLSPYSLFGIGVLAGAVGFALRYLSQECYSESDDDKDNYEKWGDRFRYSAIAAALTGYALFGTAIVFSYKAVLLSHTP